MHAARKFDPWHAIIAAIGAIAITATVVGIGLLILQYIRR